MPITALPKSEAGKQCYLMSGDLLKYEPAWHSFKTKRKLESVAVQEDCLASLNAGLKRRKTGGDNNLNAVVAAQLTVSVKNKLAASSGRGAGSVSRDKKCKRKVCTESKKNYELNAASAVGHDGKLTFLAIDQQPKPSYLLSHSTDLHH